MIDLNKEREAFLDTFQYYKGRRDIIFSHEHELFMTRSNNPSEIAQKEISNMNSRWDAWLRCAKHRDAELEKAKAQAVPETHVLVEKSKIHKWYQDANEPESFSNDDSEDGLRSLGDLIDDNGIMEVEIHESALISTKKAFGVWKSKSPTDICTNFVLVETLEEAEKILANNKAMYERESGAEG